MVTSLKLKFNQSAEKSKAIEVPTKVGGLIPTKPRTGFVPGTLHAHTKYSKLNFPTFEGENPKGWVYKCKRFFKYNELPKLEKVGIASMHLEGKALNWSQGYEPSVKHLNWETLATDITARFRQGTYDNPIGQITKLKQISSIHIHHEQFEALMVRTKGLKEGFFVQCFISGLRDTIKNQVMMSQPTTLSKAIGLALLQENTMEAMIKKAKSLSCNTTNLTPYTQEMGQGNSGKIPPIKKISQAEMLVRREKKLSYYCDEKYEPRHKCKRRQIYLLEGEEEGETIGDNNKLEEEEEEPLVLVHAIAGATPHQTMQIRGNIKKNDIIILIDSENTHNFLDVETIGDNNKLEEEEEEPLVLVHAISGATPHQTMQIRGNIKKNDIIILIDSKNTHNFIDVTMAKRTGFIIHQDKPLMVTVENGTKIASIMTCK